MIRVSIDDPFQFNSCLENAVYFVFATGIAEMEFAGAIKPHKFFFKNPFEFRS